MAQAADLMEEIPEDDRRVVEFVENLEVGLRQPVEDALEGLNRRDRSIQA